MQCRHIDKIYDQTQKTKAFLHDVAMRKRSRHSLWPMGYLADGILLWLLTEGFKA